MYGRKFSLVKRDYDRISDDIPPRMKIFEHGYPHSTAFLQFCLKFKRFKPHTTACHPTNNVKLFQTVYPSISDVIQPEVALPKQVHKNVSLEQGLKSVYPLKL